MGHVLGAVVFLKAVNDETRPRFYRGGRGMADPAFSLLSWRPRSDRSSILASIAVATEWPIPHPHFYHGSFERTDLAFSLLSRWPRSGRPLFFTSIVVWWGRVRVGLWRKEVPTNKNHVPASRLTNLFIKTPVGYALASQRKQNE